jgi:hypothetical protein
MQLFDKRRTMKKFIACFTLLLVLTGCQNKYENAPVNMKKGNSFYDAREYDVAQYYYQKIPEESPLYLEAKAKLDSIAIFKKYYAIPTATEEDLKKIILIDHSFSMNLSTMKPLHAFVVLNNTQRTLTSITVEFTYFDFDHNAVAQLVCDVDAPVPSMKKGVFSRVEPGVLKTTFVKATAKLIGAQY